MGVYRRMSGPHKDPKDLFVSVKEDGDKAVMYTPSGVKVFHRKEIEEVENEVYTMLHTYPNLADRDLIPYVDACNSYIFLTDKPKINGVTLEGDKSTDDLKIFGKISAEGVFFEDGESVQEKWDKGAFGTRDYNELTNRPTINGIVLCDDKNAVQLGVIDDETVTDVKTWSSKYITQFLNNHANVIELVGTDAEPIIASELSIGSYVLSGKVQSSVDNVTTIRIPRKQYIVNRDIKDTTILWDSNPYVATQYYILLSHTGFTEPQEKTVEIITKEMLAEAKFDCGEF